MNLNFVFHDIAALHVETEDQQAADFFRAEYRPYLTAEAPQGLPTVSLRFRRGRMQSAPVDWPRHVHKVLARWAYRIRLDDGGIEIEAVGNYWAIPMVHHMLAHPSLRYLAARRGVLMLHAGAVAFGGRSLLFTGHGGVGKTTTVSVILSQGGGVALHADDYVFVTPQGETFSYLTRSHLYWPLLSWVPQLRERLTFWERVRLRILGAIRQWSRDGLKWTVRVEQERLWPNTPHERRARLAAMVWLERADGSRASLKPFSPTEGDVEALLEMNFYEARHFLTLLRAQDDSYDQNVAEWREREAELLRGLVGAVSSYRLAIPRNGKDTSFVPDLLALVKE